jgi:hypothetical protein
MSGLPLRNISKNTNNKTTQYFDTYYTTPINLSDNDLNSVVSFFERRGFEKTAAIAVANVLLQQAKLENIKIYKLIDTLKSYDSGNKLSSVVAEILNYNRKRTSVIGYKTTRQKKTLESRNIIEGNPISTLDVLTNLLDLSSTEYTMDSGSQTLDGE